ncbi:phosphoenolpyruvate hydrolase family protein [Paenibacillus thalictri]|uniref:Phosphoenolpyruvate hydrolase family protein n=1 Tax=Paenibacillus thalictri TaxID=2527873 RepID=A0A4Q9DKE1_9BACL|nr:phosphoenolpyruvate hydrolase family protein [Paenibacillus thalictri]TBL75251.1 phosphoenolpyruvate hydrolase family protein [Paenibacillus thalictri]
MIPRRVILERLHRLIQEGRPIIGTGAGTGITAKFEEEGGSDLIIIYNSGRFRMAGRGSMSGLMPYGDANAIVMEMAGEILPVVKRTPVLAGVCGTDPFRSMPRFLKQVQEAGFSGVQNFPTVGLYDGRFRANLEETGISYDQEVEMIRLARELDLLTTPYCFTHDEARKMAAAGADIVVAHVGTTTSGSIGAQTTMSLEEAAAAVQGICDGARAVNPDIIVICHGGPIAEPEDAAFILKHTTGVQGFYGASSAERLPVERAVAEHIRKFTSLSLK